MGVDRERKLQNRALTTLIDELGYRYIGNLEDLEISRQHLYMKNI